jgi:hypothetical protein
MLCLLNAGGVARADAHSSSGGTSASGKRLKHLTKILKLTIEQQQQIAPILQDTENLTFEVRQDQSLSGAEKLFRNNMIIDRSNKKIEAVLDEKQEKKFVREEARMRERVEDEGETPLNNPGPPSDGGPPPGDGPPPDGGPPPG